MNISANNMDILVNSAQVFAEEIMQYKFNLPLAWDFSTSKRELASWQNGFVENFGEYHLIKLNVKAHKNESDLFNTICHELIHAWQFENKLDVNHSDDFILQSLKFERENINTYSNDCDLELIYKLKAKVYENA